MKQPNWKPALILSSTVFVLGSFTYWLQYSHKPKKERVDSESKKPISLQVDIDQIAAIKVKSAQGLIELKCESLAKKTCKIGSIGDWSISHPQALKGDTESIREFLNNANGMQATETIDLGEETPEKRARLFEEYGLSDAKRTAVGAEFVELVLENGKRLTAWFGENHPIGDKIFVGSAIDGKLQEKTVFLIANFYKGQFFGKPLTYFRDKSVFHFNLPEITSFVAKTSSGKLEGKLEGGIWKINGMEADQDRIETLLTAISQVRAKEFPGEAEMKGSKQSVSYSIQFKSGPALTFQALTRSGPKKDAEKKYFLTSSTIPVPVEIESNLLVQIDKKVNELRRNLLITKAEKASITEVSLSGKPYPKDAIFHLEGTAWQQKDSGTKLDSAKLASFLDQLASAHSPEIVTPAPSVSADAVTLRLGDGKNPSRFDFVVYQVKEKAYAKSKGARSNEAYLLDTSLKNLFPFKPDSWKVGK